MEDIVYSYYPRPYNLIYKETVKRMPFHMHNETEIVLCDTSGLEVAAGSSIHRISGENLIFLPSNCVHRLKAEENLQQNRFILTISPTWLSGALGRDNRLMISSLEPRVLKLSGGEFERLKAMLSECLKSSGLKRLSLLFGILDECEALLGKERLQSETGFNSYSHFSRTFKKYMDLTPKQYKSKKYYFDTVN